MLKGRSHVMLGVISPQQRNRTVLEDSEHAAILQTKSHRTSSRRERSLLRWGIMLN